MPEKIKSKLYEQAIETFQHAVCCACEAKKKAEEAMVHVKRTEEIARKITRQKWTQKEV